MKKISALENAAVAAEFIPPLLTNIRTYRESLT